jgi:hypothetical protein
MNGTETFQLALAILASLGGGGALVLGLSAYLGKVWAEYFMTRERASLEREMERLRADLTAHNSRELEALRTSLDLSKTKLLSAHADKVLMYRMVGTIISEMLADMATVASGKVMSPEQSIDRMHRFDLERLKAYTYLGMFAPQHVMDSFDRVIDHLFAVLEGSARHDFSQIRELGIGMLNEIRIDLGIDPSPIQYRGAR